MTLPGCQRLIVDHSCWGGKLKLTHMGDLLCVCFFFCKKKNNVPRSLSVVVHRATRLSTMCRPLERDTLKLRNDANGIGTKVNPLVNLQCVWSSVDGALEGQTLHETRS